MSLSVQATNTCDTDGSSGSLLFGGVDTAKYSGCLKNTPIQALNGTSKPYLAVELTSVVIENETNRRLNVLKQKTIVVFDSGSSGATLPNNTVFELYKHYGAVYDLENGPIIPCNTSAAAENLTFSFGQTGPRISTSLQNFISPLYLRMNSSKLASLESFGPTCSFNIRPQSLWDSVPYLGMPFLRSAYTVFDLENDQIGLAQAVPNAISTNIVEISSDGGHHGFCSEECQQSATLKNAQKYSP